MLELNSLSVDFGEKTVLNEISCTVQPGDFVIVVGANGSGKTTLFNAIAGKLKPTSGTILIDKRDVTHTSEQERASFLGRLFQNPLLNCIPSMTVAENIGIALCKNTNHLLASGIDPAVRKAVMNIASACKLKPALFFEKPMGLLSGGQRQTIALMMATLVKPKILLLDEPTAALDPQAATSMLQFTIDYVAQHALTTLMITHDPQIALSIGNKVWVLDQGKLVKIIDETEKAQCNPADLIGTIDYAGLAIRHSKQT